MSRAAKTVTVDYDVAMQTRDGVTLRGDVHRPAGNQKVPAILLRTPYDKTSARTDRATLNSVRPLLAARSGFAFVTQDVRGRFASDGVADPASTDIEGRDGFDTVEWVASQPWCDGRVGMIGGSYASLTQWMAAMERPPSLRAIVPERTGGRNAGLFGAMQLDSTMIGWLAGQALDTIRKRIATGEATAADLDRAREAFSDPQASARHLPLDDLPFLRSAGLPSYAEQVARFLSAATSLDPAAVDVPALVTTGWYDMATGDAAEVFTGIRRSAGAEASGGSRLIAGPWQHTGLDAHLGEWFFGNHASALGMGLPELELRFLRRWLRDEDTDIPVATYFVMGAGLWRQAEEWPPPGTELRTLFLGSGGAANGSGGDGRLVWSPAGTDRHDSFRYDPHDPVPSFGGRFYDLGGSIPGPFDQERIERRRDVLVYTGDPVDEPIEIAGPLRLRLHVSSSAVDTDFMAKLCDVGPDGRSHNIADGFVRCRWRSGVDRCTWLVPDEVVELVIDLGVVAHRFGNGHRIRLQVTSSCFPAWDRNMNTGGPLGSDRTGVVAEQRVHHGGDLRSGLELPVSATG